MTAVSSVDPTVLAKVDDHSTEHGTIAKQIDGVQVDMHRVIMSLGMLVQQSKSPIEAMPKALNEKLTSLQLDVKGVENALQLSSLASSRHGPAEEPKLLEVHEKLDSIARLCEDLLSKHEAVPKSATVPIDGLPIRASRVGADTAKSPAPSDGMRLAVKPDEEQSAGEEVAQIMADVVSGRFSCSQYLADCWW